MHRCFLVIKRVKNSEGFKLLYITNYYYKVLSMVSFQK